MTRRTAKNAGATIATMLSTAKITDARLRLWDGQLSINLPNNLIRPPYSGSVVIGARGTVTYPFRQLGEETMAIDNAEQYADSLAAGIRANTLNGYPFGARDLDTDDIYADYEEAVDQGVPGENIIPAGGLDYLTDALDIEYRVGSDGRFKSGKILITFGGPNAWIDTDTGELIVAWYSEPVRRKLPTPFING